MPESFLASAPAHRPHDLLWIGDASAVRPVEALPAWASAAWLAVAPVVVRRAPFLGDRVPVGLRGASRSERCAAHVHAHQVIRKVTPQDIARGVSGRLASLRSSRLPCLRALARLACGLDEAALSWGVTGGVGFTLASGFDVLRAASDLDLLVRSVDGSDAKALRELGRSTGDAESHVDVQVETPCGAFALNEWLRTGGPVLLKTADGPLLCDDPWHGGSPNPKQPGSRMTA